jgi:hypothetical protein
MKTIKLLLTLALLSCQPAYADRILSGDIVEGVVTQKNYLGNKGHFEKNAAGWIGYDDAAATPVDGTGGTVTTTCTRTTTTPLSGDGSFLYTPAALGEGCAASFVIDSKDKGRVLQLSFDYSVVSGTYTDDDTQIWIVETGTPTVIQPAPFKIKKTGITEKFAVEFQTLSTATSYRVLIHQATAGTAVLKFDNFQLGPQAKLYGSPVTDETSWTPTLTNAGNATVVATRGQIGDNIRLLYTITIGSSLPTGSIIFSKPTDVAFTFTTNVIIADAIVKGTVTASGATYQGAVRWDNTNSTMSILGGDGQQFWNATVPFTWAAGDSIVVAVQAKVVGWSSSQIMSSDASTRVVAARYGSTQTTSITTAFVLIDYDALSHDDTGSVTTGASWKFTAKSPGIYRVSASMYLASVNLSTTQACGVWVYKNGSAAGELGRQAGVGVARNYVVGGSTNIKLVAGDYISIYGFSDVTTNMGSNAGLSHVSIEKIQGPAQILASENISAVYRGVPTGSIGAAWNTITYPTKIKDSHLGYSSGIYTINSSGTYSISAMFNATGTFAVNQGYGIGIYIDDVEAYTKYDAAGGSIGGVAQLISVNSIPLLAGQNIRIKAYVTGSGLAYAAATQNQFSITRTGNY